MEYPVDSFQSESMQVAFPYFPNILILHPETFSLRKYEICVYPQN